MKADSRSRLFARVEKATELPMLLLAVAFLVVFAIPEVMELSPATIKREWAMARAWLHQALTEGPIDQTSPPESI